ncbi:hypothetical protein V6N11_032732 [Hibiscus sabdariffa]|uniref:(+)-delta-cadinene synthase n=1 Tax=Hibiscus sabdariffa TaxID=183260 RepID=A0ABR2T1P7_9ROSI
MDCSRQLQTRTQLQVLSCHLNSEASDVIQPRRSANYKPNIWKYDFLQSLLTKYDGVEYKLRAEELRENVKAMFVEAQEELAKLELIDIIRKLGLGDLFAEETQKALQAVVSSEKKNKNGEEDLYVTALRFKLLRLHGYEDAFSVTKSNEIKGLLELYEASYLAFQGENILDEAKTFSREALRKIYSTLDTDIAKEVGHALELSSHWRVQWFDVKWRITVYENRKNIDKRLLELAKLNFNTVQATLQKDLREISRWWWWNLGIMEHLNFTRDRLAESFLCAVGVAYEPQFSCFRKRLTKITTMILILDDVYDVYGSLQELEQFTQAVDRWDSSKIQLLPGCLKTCFQALYDITDEIAYDIQELNGRNVQASHHLRKAWTGFCKALFVEAKWDAEAHNLVYNISVITRLCNDLGTSAVEKERGDAPSSILCHMRETNVSEKEAEEHIKKMISNTWMKINRQCLMSQPPDMLPCSFVKVTVNVARMVHCLYEFGDGFGVQDGQTRNHIRSVLIEPFHLDCL